ncbi:hypothetical protein E0H73_33965 [Kribbella pittospori]|uniref:Recombinase family protein n=1 Tax=Kribbella pittospori TaxID=722689 RepID=A0A4V2M9P1_9ACTN|nr:hypothetical protein [Kribbella pittospori]TCC56162.1 hypothetical protein E0H73_33965 [Kribbella pittospori]
MTDPLTPAVGYLRHYRSMTRDQLVQAEERLATLAGQQGFFLQKVFVEHLHTDPAAFDKLIKTVKRRKIPAVIVLAQAHLSAVGDSETKVQRLHRETHAHAVAASASPALTLADPR